jgi:hypothetical protein
MDTQIFDEIIVKKQSEIKELYENKISKNKKMNVDPSKIDYNSAKTFNLINATLEKKLKSSKLYQKKIEKELQNGI